MFNIYYYQSKLPLVRDNIKLVAIDGLCYSFMLKGINQDVSYKQAVSAVSSSYKEDLHIVLVHLSEEGDPTLNTFNSF
jgi:hypothetical protein